MKMSTHEWEMDRDHLEKAATLLALTVCPPPTGHRTGYCTDLPADPSKPCHYFNGGLYSDLYTLFCEPMLLGCTAAM